MFLLLWTLLDLGLQVQQHVHDDTGVQVEPHVDDQENEAVANEAHDDVQHLPLFCS
jgi:hypothetical protein